ncbi:MAG: anaerobic ribonucleoside-triphosphate reductase [Spirochaetales bacterium]
MNEVRTIEVIDADIANVKAALENVRGTETEVYARIVGYYRSVRNWNKGKRDEYDLRKHFVLSGVPEMTSENTLSETQNEETSCITTVAKIIDNENDMNYEFFTRRTCPNCQPVKKYLEDADVSGKQIDVDTEEGLARAAEIGIFSTPTVVVFGADGTEIGRTHDAVGISELFALKAENVA